MASIVVAFENAVEASLQGTPNQPKGGQVDGIVIYVITDTKFNGRLEFVQRDDLGFGFFRDDIDEYYTEEKFTALHAIKRLLQRKKYWISVTKVGDVSKHKTGSMKLPRGKMRTIKLSKDDEEQLLMMKARAEGQGVDDIYDSGLSPLPVAKSAEEDSTDA